METRQRCQKPCWHWNPRNVHRKPQGVRMDKRAGIALLAIRSENNWPKPWSQENELEPEQVTSTVATETKLEQLFDWRQHSTYNQIRKLNAYCMRFKTKQWGPLKADVFHQAEQILFQFVQNENFPNVSKSIANNKEISKNIEHRQGVTLPRGRWNN